MGVPAFDLFPFDIWAKLNGAFWRKPNLELLCYGDPAGDDRLRGLIAAYLRSSRGMQCTAEQIVITSGAQQAISLRHSCWLSLGTAWRWKTLVIALPATRSPWLARDYMACR